jgi:hypothetical protein
MSPGLNAKASVARYVQAVANEILNRRKTRPMSDSGQWELVAVTWVDAFDGDTGWTDTDDYEPQPTIALNVGFIWPNKLKDHVTLISGYIHNEEWPPEMVSNVCHIPSVMIRNVTRLASSLDFNHKTM